VEKPTTEEAQNAVRLLLEYIGENTSREGLKDTPERVIKSYAEIFSGYNKNIHDILNKKFYDISEYNDVVLLKSINFTSTCEHHMLPFYGTVDIAYLPDKVILGISKLARLVDVFSKQLQIQERMTTSIACTLQEHLKPKGVVVRINATHSCMTTRGTMKGGSTLESVHFTGKYQTDPALRSEFWDMVKN
jgi:GTP cyclohydrolase I